MESGLSDCQSIANSKGRRRTRTAKILREIRKIVKTICMCAKGKNIREVGPSCKYKDTSGLRVISL